MMEIGNTAINKSFNDFDLTADKKTDLTLKITTQHNK